MKRFAGVLMFRCEGAAASEKDFRRDAERVMRAVADATLVLDPLQITSVTCLDAPPKADGTNGPKTTLTETVAADDTPTVADRPAAKKAAD